MATPEQTTAAQNVAQRVNQLGNAIDAAKALGLKVQLDITANRLRARVSLEESLAQQQTSL